MVNLGIRSVISNIPLILVLHPVDLQPKDKQAAEHSFLTENIPFCIQLEEMPSQNPTWPLGTQLQS